MARTIGADLLATLQQEVVTVTVLVKLTRQDSTVLGFTSFDEDITFNGVTYEKSSALDATALRGQLGSGVDNMELMGLLNSHKITDTDLLAGLYDGSTVELYLINYLVPSQGVVTLLTGTLGEVNFEDGQYTVEFRSLSQRLSQQVVELTSPTCRVQAFGDARCAANGGVGGTHPLSFFQRTGVAVVSVPSSTQINFGADPNPAGYYDYGRIIFTSGLNNGIIREVKSHVVSPGNAVLNLQEPFPFTVAPGDVATLEAGCDRNFSTCVGKFSNAANFRGEPHVPGTDQILQRGRR